MLGITIRSSDTAQPFWQLVELASAFEVESCVLKLGYPPHLTLARYDKIDMAPLVAALDIFNGLPALTLVFDRICAFDTDPLILWLAPRPDARLFEVHARLHTLLGIQLGDPHYHPGAWRPHCTIATMIPKEQRNSARAFANESFEPFAITFDMADALEWPPINQIDARQLV